MGGVSQKSSLNGQRHAPEDISTSCEGHKKKIYYVFIVIGLYHHTTANR